MLQFVVLNVANKPAATHEAMARGDYAVLNECRDEAKAAIRKKARVTGFRAYIRAGSQNVHMWRTREAGVVAHGGRLLLHGGRRGAGKSRRDRRRRGPSRDASWQLVYDVDNLGLLLVIDWHQIARYTTSERWRKPLALAALARLRALLVVLILRYPGVPVVVAGDGNTPKLGAWRLGHQLHAVHTPPDFGRRHYSQVYVRGPVDVANVRRFASISDHDGLSMDLQVHETAPKFKAKFA